jgi:pimeloyl-ACP methyl ester carboxylesterase
MAEIVPPVLPDCLVSDWEANQALQQRQAELQQYSVNDYAATMLPVHQSAEGLHFVDTIDSSQEFVDNEQHAVVIPIPFATGWRPHMAARVDLLNAALGGNQRIIGLPNSTWQARTTEYSPQERSLLAVGNYTPFEDRVLRLLDTRRIEHVSIAGYSQGAALGVHFARAIAERGVHRLEAAALSDMPTVVERSLGRLCTDFVRTGTTSYQRVMDETGIPMLRESVEKMNACLQQFDRLQYMATVLLPENRALVQSMRNATFGTALMRAINASDARFGLMRLEDSTVTPAADYEQLVQRTTTYFPDRITSLEIPGYGHEFGDHSVALALVEARTLVKY